LKTGKQSVFSGCKTGPGAELYGYNPFRRQGPEETEYGPTAVARRQELLELAAQAKNLPPAEQMRLGTELAMRMQNEVDPVLRSDAVKALGNISTETAKEALRMALKDGEASVRIAACQAWQNIGGPEAIDVLSTVVASDTDDDVRLAAARALGAFRDPAAVRGLAIALDDNNPALQHRAMESLRIASGQNYGYDVVAWRTYVEGGSPTTPDRGPSLVERFFDRR
jgi:HEAT repeat protein